MPQPHESQLTPPNDTVLWRYMDLSQFLWVLATQQLHFSSWKTFHDIHEGDVPDQWVQEKMRRSKGTMPPADSGYYANMERASRFGIEGRLKQFRISCWHRNVDESIAMWNLYPKGTDGVAIQTTVGDLRASVHRALLEEHTHIGPVTYDGFPVEYDHTLGNVQLIPLLVKRPWYRHEQEIRMIRWAGVESEEPHGRRDQMKGENVPVDLTRLIKRIVISPDYPAHLLLGLQWAIEATKLELPTVQASSCQPSVGQ